MDTGARFIWSELSTTDKEKAGKFYGRLLGWDVIPQPLWTRSGQAIDYTLLQLGGLNVGGMYPMVGLQRSKGIRPSWLSYVLVEDAAKTTAKTKELGGKVLAGPLDVLDLGRMSILSDPQGALFGTWQALRLDSDFQTRCKPGFTSWFEHVSEDVAPAVRFYGSLFGWKQSNPGQGGDRVLLEEDGAAVAGFNARTRSSGKLPPQWVTFFQVADCEASCQKVATLQGSVLAPPVGAPGTARFALASDPQGATFGLLTPDPG